MTISAYSNNGIVRGGLRSFPGPHPRLSFGLVWSGLVSNLDYVVGFFRLHLLKMPPSLVPCLPSTVGPPLVNWRECAWKEGKKQRVSVGKEP